MLSVSKNFLKITCKTSNLRLMFLPIGRNSSQIAKYNFLIVQSKTLPPSFCYEFNKTTNIQCKMYPPLEQKRYYSKKKGSKRSVEVEEESDSEEEEEYQEQEDDVGSNVISKTVPSIRLDSILKVGLNLTKKKIEQEFYAFKLRVNGDKVLKKSMNLHVGDEIDRVKGFSPDTSKYLVVDRVIFKGTGSVTGSGMYPVKLEVLKDLIIENYEDPWSPSSLGQLED